MTNHKQRAKGLTINELRLYVNEYQKRKYNKQRKSQHNTEYYHKIKHNTELKAKVLPVYKGNIQHNTEKIKILSEKKPKHKILSETIKGDLDIFKDMKGGKDEIY